MTKFLKNADVTGYISQTLVTSSLLKTDSAGKLVAATAGTDYQAPTTALLPTGGTAGQILSKIDATNYNTHWIDNFAAQLKHDVKLGATLAKGKAVYVSSANGTNMIVSAASNDSEATSSKTLGLLETGGATNDIVKVITEGLLAGLDTSTATAGDPVWLGTSGDLIFGLANKPVAPAHLVFIGVVTRVQSVNGEIFIKVQNGFELNEIHNVLLSSEANNDGLFYESATSLWKNKSIATVLGYTPVAGTGTTSYLPKFTATGTIGNSAITDNGTTVTLVSRALSGTSATFSGDLTLNNGSADGGQLVLASSGYSSWNLDNFSGRFRAYYGSTEYLTITSAGNVGIGTSSPGAKLNVNGAASQFGSPTQQTSGSEYIVIGQNSSTGPDDANCLGLTVIHAAASASPSVQLTYQFRTNDNSSANLYGHAIKVTKDSGANSTFTTFSTNTGVGAGTERMRISSSGFLCIGTTDTSGNANLMIGGNTTNCRVLPVTDGGGYIGDSVHRWIAIYAQNGSINTSDRNQKKNIVPTDLGLSFVNQLNPVSYSWKEGEETEKKHYGIIAQEVEAIAPDFGGIWNENGKYGFSYTELISPLIKSIQELSAKVTALESK